MDWVVGTQKLVYELSSLEVAAHQIVQFMSQISVLIDGFPSLRCCRLQIYSGSTDQQERSCNDSVMIARTDHHGKEALTA